jgi:hypothetical protein
MLIAIVTFYLGGALASGAIVLHVYRDALGASPLLAAIIAATLWPFLICELVIRIIDARVRRSAGSRKD